LKRTLAPHCVWCSAGVRINSTLYFTLKDHLGSASVVTDASGNVVGENRYYPFGETRLTTGTIFTDKLFTGQREMAGLGIYHYNARFYSPKLGRFLSADTIVPGAANPQAWNRFSYVTNNPLRYTDPTGHMQASEGYTESDGQCSAGDTSCNWLQTSQDKLKKPKKDKTNGRDGQTPSPSGVATMATVLDTSAMALNGGYAFVGDLIGLVCKHCYPVVIGVYEYYSYIPNTVSTVSMLLWIADGAETGENRLTRTQTSQGTTTSFSVSQDTIVAVGTNALGWRIKEPNVATALDIGVAGYDLARLGTIPFVDYTLPAFINPTLTYNTNTGLDFSWQQK
jgi:RHS repeat-associated protein